MPLARDPVNKSTYGTQNVLSCHIQNLKERKSIETGAVIYKTKDLLFVYLTNCQELYALPVQTEMLMKVH